MPSRNQHVTGNDRFREIPLACTRCDFVPVRMVLMVIEVVMIVIEMVAIVMVMEIKVVVMMMAVVIVRRI